MQQKTITLSAASKMFGASKMFLYKLCRNGGLTGKQVGRPGLAAPVSICDW
jgi:hypothetical protein